MESYNREESEPEDSGQFLQIVPSLVFLKFLRNIFKTYSFKEFRLSSSVKFEKH